MWISQSNISKYEESEINETNFHMLADKFYLQYNPMLISFEQCLEDFNK